MSRKVLLVVLLAALAARSEAQATLRLHILASRVVTQSTQSGSNCGFWTQNGYTWGSCFSSDNDSHWAVNAVETDRMRYLLSCSFAPFRKCSTLTVGLTYEAEECGGSMCVHLLYGKHRKPAIIRYAIVETVLR
jgi:hypothetical protein